MMLQSPTPRAAHQSSAMAEPMPPKSLSTSAQQLYSGARGAFLAAQLVGDVCRPGCIAMLALQLELANIRHQVTEPLLGQIRLTWWREQLSAMPSPAAGQHPILQELVAARAKLPPAQLDQLLTAQAEALDYLPASNWPGLQDWAQRIGRAQLLLLAAQLNSAAADIPAAAQDLAQPAGLAIGLLQLLQQCGAANLADALCANHQSGHQGGHQDNTHQHDLSAAVATVRITAEQALQQAASLLRALPRDQRPAFFGLIATKRLLRQLASHGDQLSRLDYHRPDPWRAWRLYRLVSFGRL
ncbi:MAG: squalene/phytoene synthase family protein [Holosporaceae bacterium]